jgi:hypothetical protein
VSQYVLLIVLLVALLGKHTSHTMVKYSVASNLDEQNVSAWGGTQIYIYIYIVIYHLLFYVNPSYTKLPT